VLSEERAEIYIAILDEELLLAAGCTEPIAIAYCAATLRDLMGCEPERILVEVSGNVQKNVKSVVVPNTGGMRGIRAAVAAGYVAGDPKLDLQVIASISNDQLADIRSFLDGVPIEISPLQTQCILEIRIAAVRGSDKAVVHVANNHSNIVYLEKNGEVLFERTYSNSPEDNLQDKSVLNVADIVTFADTVDIARVSRQIERQISYNSALAEEGLRGDWGASIGKILLNDGGGAIQAEAMAYAAAGSDARMGGCKLPAVILSGSGNQGITSAMPVVRYAKRIGATQEQLYRALLVSDLVTIHQKTGIGRLSAYCGAISAGVGAGAGIAYLLGGGLDAVSHTIVNAVAILSGTICDGAKPSCAAKIAFAVEAGIFGYRMYCNDRQFYAGDGIVAKGVEKTIANVGALASEGMQQTDTAIVSIMLEE
jgi:L-cysteine desulfidase